MLITKEVADQIKAQHGDYELYKLSTPFPGGDPIEAIVKVPDRNVWRLTREMVNSRDPAKMVAATQMLFDACVLYPSGTARDALVAERPGIVGTWVGEISELAGVLQGTTVSKL
jgi:hypothetical protein